MGWLEAEKDAPHIRMYQPPVSCSNQYFWSQSQSRLEILLYIEHWCFQMCVGWVWELLQLSVPTAWIQATGGLQVWPTPVPRATPLWPLMMIQRTLTTLILGAWWVCLQVTLLMMPPPHLAGPPLLPQDARRGEAASWTLPTHCCRQPNGMVPTLSRYLSLCTWLIVYESITSRLMFEIDEAYG